MWCRNCQQDVPAVPSVDDARERVCIRCQRTLVAGEHPGEREAGEGTSSPIRELPDFSDWDRSCQSVERVLRALDVLRIDDQHVPASPTAEPPLRIDLDEGEELPAARPATWLLPGYLWPPLGCALACGLGALLCRAWTSPLASWIGGGLTLAGQIALASGLIRVARRVENTPAPPEAASRSGDPRSVRNPRRAVR